MSERGNDWFPALLAPVDDYAGCPGAQKGATGVIAGADPCALGPSTDPGITSARKIIKLIRLCKTFK